MSPYELRWYGGLVVCVASGPSLSAHQIELVARARAGRPDFFVISVNNAFKLTHSFADVIYAGDCAWWKQYLPEIKATGTKAELWTQDNTAAARHSINRYRGSNSKGLGTYEIHTNGNSGAQAVNLAFLWGAGRILLIGYDMQATGGKRHFDGDHPAPLVQAQLFNEWIHRFGVMAKDLEARGVEVVNCSEQTAMHCFRRASLEDELERLM